MPDIDLDVQVAELLGYTCLPDGRWVTPNDLEWLPPYQRGLIIEDPPRVTAVLNLAWRLLDRHTPFEVCRARDGQRSVVWIGGEFFCTALDDTPEAMAEAICRAWVAFKRKG